MDYKNVLRWFQDTAERKGKDPCLRYKQGQIWKALSWTDTLGRIKSLSEAIKKEGVVRGDRVCILSNTRYEWALIDMAILSLGAVTVPIYQSNTAEEVEYILNNSETRMVFVEDSTQLEKVLKVRSSLSHLEKIILIHGSVMGDGVLTLEEFEKNAKGISSDFDSRVREIGDEDLATLVYTSGTTGPPKGVMLTHGNLLGEIKALNEVFPPDAGQECLIFLPLAHILARVLQFFQLTEGFSMAYAESVEKLVDNLGEIRPHFLVCVPRIFEKVYQNMMANVQASSSLKQSIFHWAKGVGAEYSRCLLDRKTPGLSLKIRHGLAHKLVFSKLHARLGGRIQFFISGGAPLSAEIAAFFHGAGFIILEGYGLTETTAAVNCNRMDNYEFGTVGPPLLGVEEKIAEDGEIIVRGSVIAKGYWKRPDATAEAFDKDGWFHTGDIGHFTDKGLLKITDRKKDIIVTAGGKNIAPQNIENIIKTDPLISQVVVHGDRRKFLSALITLDPDELKKRANALGYGSLPNKELVKKPEIEALVKKVVDEKNQKFAKYETIKKFAILDKDFSIEGGELTPTLKVKRKIINERFKDILDQFYQE